MSVDERDAYENAGGRPKEGKNMLFFRPHHLHHLVGHLSVVVLGFFVQSTGDKYCKCGASWTDGFCLQGRKCGEEMRHSSAPPCPDYLLALYCYIYSSIK